MPDELLATCWTHTGDALPVAGHHLSPLDLRDRAEAVAAAGFTGIGFTIDDLQAALATYGLPQVKRICDDLGLVHREVELLESWWTTGSRREESDRTRRSLLRAAEALGARTIKIGPDVQLVDGGVPPLADVAHWASELHLLAVQADEVGSRVALEPLPFSNIADFRLAAELVAAADHPAAGLVVDIWHLERGPSTLADLAEIPGDRVFVVELNDAPAPQSTDLFHETTHRRVLCGSGTFDVTGFVGTLRQIGFAGPWGVEIISDAHRRRPLQEALTDAHLTTMAMLADTGAGWLPATWVHPTRVDLSTGHHLRPIHADDTELDMRAVMGSRERLWAIYGEAWGWPPATMTAEQDREDLQRHWEEILAHESFNYALFDEAETELLGCVYIDPPEKPGADAEISWWVRDEHVGSDVESALDELVPRWIAERWPFRAPRYVGRNLSWAEWIALPDLT